jgi:hypothetical protein
MFGRIQACGKADSFFEAVDLVDVLGAILFGDSSNRQPKAVGSQIDCCQQVFHKK